MSTTDIDFTTGLYQKLELYLFFIFGGLLVLFYFVYKRFFVQKGIPKKKSTKATPSPHTKKKTKSITSKLNKERVETESILEANEAQEEESIILNLKKEKEDDPQEELQRLVASIRLFQSLDEKIIRDIAQHVQTRTLQPNQVLFGREENGVYEQTNIYIVVKGKVSVFVDSTTDKRRVLKESWGSVNSPVNRQLLSVFKDGQCITSMLTVLEWLAKSSPSDNSVSTSTNEDQLKSDSNEYIPTEILEEELEDPISAIAETETVVAELSLNILSKYHQLYPRPFSHLIQALLRRLHRVTILSINHYFGLAKELIQIQVSVPQTPSNSGSGTNELKARAAATLASLFNLPRKSEKTTFIKNKLEIVRFRPGELVMKPSGIFSDTTQDFGMFIVMKGRLGVSLLEPRSEVEKEEENDQESKPKREFLYFVHENETVGELALLTGELYYQIEALPSGDHSTRSKFDEIIVARLSKHWFDRLVESSPNVLNMVIKLILSKLSPLAKQVDTALDWHYIQAGAKLYQEGDATDAMYVILSGRLRAIRDSSKSKTFIDESSLFNTIESRREKSVYSEFGRGDALGTLEILTDAPRPSTVIAVRDTELAQIPVTLFNLIIQKHPQVTVHFSRLIGHSLSRQLLEKRTHGGLNFSTVAVIGVDPTVPLAYFARRLEAHLSQIVPTLHLDKNTPLEFLGKDRFTPHEEVSLIRWLAEMEERNKIVLYQCDPSLSPWTRRCIRQADCLLIVGWAHGSPEMSRIEKYLLQNTHQTSARKELVLLHEDIISDPQGTLKWLEVRHGWCDVVHHIRLKDTKTIKKEVDYTDQLKERVRNAMNLVRRVPQLLRNTSSAELPELLRTGARGLWNHIRQQTANLSSPFQQQTASSSSTKHSRPNRFDGNAPNPREDMARIARRLTGTSVGLILGGGGARGIAHCGVIRALEESGIPIDMVGGTSIGSFIGGLYASNPNYIHVYAKTKKFSKNMTSKWRKVLDLTYPVVAFFTGREFNEAIMGVVGDDRNIEDLWLNYFCVTTNITHSKMTIHRNGQLWRYIRASMSLVGYLPPICDPLSGNLLVDGGYVNNLPADVMRSLGINTIIAVDVGAEEDNSYTNYGDYLSGWGLLLNKINPFAEKARVPNLSDIQSHLAYVSCVKQLEKVKKQKGCLYMRPPVNDYGTLEFNRFEEILKVGFSHAKQQIESWIKSGVLSPINQKAAALLHRVHSADAKLSSLG